MNLSIRHHLPDFGDTFKKAMGDVRRPLRGTIRNYMVSWRINRIHFPATLLSLGKLQEFNLTHTTTLLSPTIARKLDEFDRSSVYREVNSWIPMTA